MLICFGSKSKGKGSQTELRTASILQTQRGAPSSFCELRQALVAPAVPALPSLMMRQRLDAAGVWKPPAQLYPTSGQQLLFQGKTKHSSNMLASAPGSSGSCLKINSCLASRWWLAGAFKQGISLLVSCLYLPTCKCLSDKIFLPL